MDIKLVVRGDPKAQKRHRHFQRKGMDFVSTYDPSGSDKKDFLSILHDQAPDVPLTGPLRVVTHFYFSRPKSHYGTGRNAGILKASAPEFHIVKPDEDNLRKFVLDALKGVYWRDDSIVCQGEQSKQYSETPRTEITIITLTSSKLELGLDEVKEML